MTKTCLTCANGFKRSEFSYKKYGSYQCQFECTLEKNERTPYRKFNDTCEDWKERDKTDE